MPMANRVWILLVAGVAAALAGCGSGDAELVVYSGRSEPLIKPFLEEFAEQEGLDVQVRFADTADLVGTLLEEGENTRADVFIGQDAASLARLAQEGLLQPYEGARKTPARFRATDASWTGLSGRARVLIVPEGGEHPDSVFDLTDPRWRGRIAGPITSNVSFRDWVSAIRLAKGDDFTRDYLEGLKRNDLEVLASHGEVRSAVGDGEFDVGLVNHYYVELEKQEGSDVEAVYTDQEPGGFGVVFNVASAGITASAENAENAEQLMAYLLTPDVQERFARANFEYPVLPGLQAAPGVRPLESFRKTAVSLEELGEAADGTDELLEEVDLDG
jgi:iron(III) transport system substrate-binding protein